MKRIAVIVGMSFLLCGFQNCQEAKISSSEDALSKTSGGNLIAVTADDPEDVQGQVAQTDDDVVIPPPATPPGGGTCPANCNNENPPGNGNGNGNGHGKPPVADNGSGANVCILEGPGKSVKLGQNAAAVPGGQNPVPGVLCMSRKACLEIASQAFNVKGPELRGYCKSPRGNPHVFHVTDAQLQIKIDLYLKR